jgi:hypothetical protein
MLLVASPAMSRLLVYPQTEFFTEMWLLGPNQMAENYPYNLTSGQNYTVYLGLGNHLGYCAYYLVEVKLRNDTQSAPSSFRPLENATPSGLPSLTNITAVVADGSVWQVPLTFSFSYGFDTTRNQVEFNSMTLNGAVLNLAGYTTAWNSTRGVFPMNLFFEAWIYNASTSSFQYHARWVGLQFNMTLT